MSHLLHIDSSIRGDDSVSRRLSARAADAWRRAHPEGTVRYRDLGASPLPHLDSAGGLARLVPPEQHTPEQAASWALTEVVVGEVRVADVVLLGMPLYNYSAPSSVKAWIDHLVAFGLTVDGETGTGLLGGRDVVVVASRGGGYGEGTPRAGWDHAETWLPHALAQIGMEPRFVTAELTLARTNPQLAHLVTQAEESLAAAERAVDELWAAVPAPAYT